MTIKDIHPTRQAWSNQEYISRTRQMYDLDPGSWPMQLADRLEAAQREIAELKAERLKPISEGIDELQVIANDQNQLLRTQAVMQVAVDRLKEIRSKYAGEKP